MIKGFDPTTLQQFATPVAPAAPAAPVASFAAPQRCQYGGIQAARQRIPMLFEGVYRLRITSCVRGRNPMKQRTSRKTYVKVLAASDNALTAANSDAVVISFTTGPGLIELKKLVMHALGFGLTLEQYSDDSLNHDALFAAAENAFDAYELSLSNGTGYSGAILEHLFEEEVHTLPDAPSIVGRLVNVIVARGKAIFNPQTGTPTKDYFRDYTWGVVQQ